MGKDHKKSRKEKKHVYVSSESDSCYSESDSCSSESDVGYHSEDDSIVSEEVPVEEESPVCKITNEDIAQAFALFDLRLRQICKKVGVSGVYDEDSTNETEKSVDEDSTNDTEKSVDEETSGSIQPLMFPQIPMAKSESGDPRLPNALKHLKFGKL